MILEHHDKLKPEDFRSIKTFCENYLVQSKVWEKILIKGKSPKAY